MLYPWLHQFNIRLLSRNLRVTMVKMGRSRQVGASIWLDIGLARAKRLFICTPIIGIKGLVLTSPFFYKI
jgi:hypothetical protein